MNCLECKNRILKGGWICWSGNKKTIAACNNGKPSKNRVIYRKGVTMREGKHD